MDISKTKIKLQLKRKTSPVLVETIRLAMKNRSWLPLAKILSSPSGKLTAVNLKEIDKKTSVGDTVVIPGKILSLGDITKKIRLCALSISDSAREKLKKSKSEIISIAEEIKKNPKAEGLKVIS